MAWENIDERLMKAFKVKVSFPAGTVLLPNAHMNIDEWLTSTAETDQELKELNIPRIRFLQNRWPIEKLLELEWDTQVANNCAMWAMYVGRRAYLLFSNGLEYQLIAAIEPRTNPVLYRAVIGKVLQNPAFVPLTPTIFRNRRPDLVPDIFETLAASGAVPEASANSLRPGPLPTAAKKKGYLSQLLIGWVGGWIDLPVLGFWHEDLPDSITTSENGEYVMKYKQTYADKQREAQKLKKEEDKTEKAPEAQPESAKRPDRKDTNAA